MTPFEKTKTTALKLFERNATSIKNELSAKQSLISAKYQINDSLFNLSIYLHLEVVEGVTLYYKFHLHLFQDRRRLLAMLFLNDGRGNSFILKQLRFKQTDAIESRLKAFLEKSRPSVIKHCIEKTKTVSEK